MINLYQVMLVDDEIGALEEIAFYVEQANLGFHVIAKAQGGEDALFYLEMIKPDLVITDIRMPVIDGLQLLTQMRTAGWGGRAAIISGYNDFAYAQQAIRLEVCEYLLKPVFPNDIYGVLERTRAYFTTEQAEKMQLRQEIRAELQIADLPAMDDLMPPYIAEAKKFIQAHYAETITLTQVAKVVSINPAHLSASFARHCGVNFLEYLTKYRLAKAKELLERTNLPIQEVASQVGYPNLTYFNRIFRRTTAQTPGAYRASYRSLTKSHPSSTERTEPF
jgi:two-component system response regulator YesN